MPTPWATSPSSSSSRRPPSAKDRLCRACFDGVYPVALPEPELLGKHVLEGIERRAVAGATADVDGRRHPAAAAARPTPSTAVSEPPTGRVLRRRRRRRRGRRACRRPDAGLGRRARSDPRSSASSAGSPACSTPPPCARYRRPLLATSTDGVGTKIAVARAMDVHDTIGIDLVAMVVDDLVVCGAEPLFMTDYIAAGDGRPRAHRRDRQRHRRGLPAGRLRAARRGDRRAPGAHGARRVRRGRRRHRQWSRPTSCSGPHRVRAGDVVIAMASSGLHSNGYSLARHGAARRRRTRAWTAHVDELGPHPRRGAAGADPHLRAGLPGAGRRRSTCTPISHVTGGGLAANLARVLPEPVPPSTSTGRPGARCRSSGSSASSAGSTGPSWSGRSTWASAWSPWWPPADADAALALLAARGVPAWVCGVVRARRDGEAGDAEAKGGAGGAVSLVAEHPA